MDAETPTPGTEITLRDNVIGVLKDTYDPEIPVDIYELGLIYKVDVTADGDVDIDMTLTTPACPVAGSMPGEVESKILALPGVRDVRVNLVWDPPWDRDMMSEAAQLELGLI